MGPSTRYPITAYGTCNALGQTVPEVNDALGAGRSGLGRPSFELPFEAVCGEIRHLLPPPPPSLASYDTRLLRMALVAYEQVAAAVEAAVDRWGPDRVAVILGTSTGGIEATEGAFRDHHGSGTASPSYDFELQHPFHLVAEALGLLGGVSGPRYVLSTACSSGGKALAAARRLLELGMIDAAVTGAFDGLSQTTLRGFYSLSILSPEPCRPFSQQRSGISIGEGASLLVLERSGEAQVELLGVGESADAYHMSSPNPDGRGARVAMERALAQAGLEPPQVDHINAHGTGTRRNDASEARAIADLFGDRVPVSSTKGYIGHQLAGGGATEAIFAMTALEQGWIPATLGADPVDEAFTISVTLERRELDCRVVMSNSFGFGGSNVAVLLGARR